MDMNTRRFLFVKFSPIGQLISELLYFKDGQIQNVVTNILCVFI